MRQQHRQSVLLLTVTLTAVGALAAGETEDDILDIGHVEEVTSSLVQVPVLVAGSGNLYRLSQDDLEIWIGDRRLEQFRVDILEEITRSRPRSLHRRTKGTRPLRADLPATARRRDDQDFRHYRFLRQFQDHPGPGPTTDAHQDLHQVGSRGSRDEDLVSGQRALRAGPDQHQCGRRPAVSRAARREPQQVSPTPARTSRHHGRALAAPRPRRPRADGFRRWGLRSSCPGFGARSRTRRGIVGHLSVDRGREHDIHRVGPHRGRRRRTAARAPGYADDPAG